MPIAGTLTPANAGAARVAPAVPPPAPPAPTAAAPAAPAAPAPTSAAPASPPASPAPAPTPAPATAAAPAAPPNGATAPQTPAAPAAPAAAAPATPAAEPAKPSEAKAEPPKEGGPDAWRFAALSKKERAIREQQDAVKAERAKLDADRKALEEARTQQTQRAERYRANPLAALEDNGISFEQIQQFVLNGQNLTPQQAAQIALESEKRTAARLEASEKAQAEALQRAQKEAQEAAAKENERRAEAAKTGFLNEIRGVAQAEAEKYELVGLAGESAIQQAYAIVDDTFQKTGTVMTVAAALEQVENALFAEAERAVKASKKLGKVFAPPPPPAPTPAPAPAPAAAPPAPARRMTLSNGMTPSATPRIVQSRETERERDERVKQQIRQSWGR